jgi:hypothetical protein
VANTSRGLNLHEISEIAFFSCENAEFGSEVEFIMDGHFANPNAVSKQVVFTSGGWSLVEVASMFSPFQTCFRPRWSFSCDRHKQKR